jgi:flagellar hook-associated protein 1
VRGRLFLSDEINNTQSPQNFNQSLSQVATLAQQILAPSSGNDLTQALQQVFNAFTNLSATPQDPTVRATVINAATNFAQQAQSVSSCLQTTASNELTQLPALVDQVNQSTQQIATLNGQIVPSTASGQGAAALMDQRAALVNLLAGSHRRKRRFERQRHGWRSAVGAGWNRHAAGRDGIGHFDRP